MRVLIAALAAVALASPAVAAEQFDLVCKGQQKLGMYAKPTPTEARYRLDLASSTWCKEDCSAIKSIYAIEPGMIVLDRRSRTPADASSLILEVERTSGQWLEVYTNGTLYWETKGTCEPAEFTGFPPKKF